MRNLSSPTAVLALLFASVALALPDPGPGPRKASISPLLHSRAIQTDAVCLPEFRWMDNSIQQSPCEVAAYILGQCHGGNWIIPKLPDASVHYTEPNSTTADSCSCSWAAYNLLQACGYCQGRAFDSTIFSWDGYKAECDGHFSSPKPFPDNVTIPAQTAIPYYAQQDPTHWENSLFDPAAALQLAQEGKPDLTQQSRLAEDSGGGTNIGAIVGGVVGGVALLAGLAICSSIVRRRRLNNKRMNVEDSNKLQGTIPDLRQSQYYQQVLNPNMMTPYGSNAATLGATPDHSGGAMLSPNGHPAHPGLHRSFPSSSGFSYCSDGATPLVTQGYTGSSDATLTSPNANPANMGASPVMTVTHSNVSAAARHGHSSSMASITSAGTGVGVGAGAQGQGQGMYVANPGSGHASGTSTPPLAINPYTMPTVLEHERADEPMTGDARKERPRVNPPAYSFAAPSGEDDWRRRSQAAQVELNAGVSSLEAHASAETPGQSQAHVLMDSENDTMVASSTAGSQKGAVGPYGFPLDKKQ